MSSERISLLKLLNNTINRIENELLKFSIAVILLLVAFSELKFWILLFYILASLFYIFVNFFRKKDDNKYLKKFEDLLEKSSWKKEIINHKEIWFCDSDNSYQIEIGEGINEFSDEWTRVYPDERGSHSLSVYLKVSGVPIKEFLFISCDGGRILVPFPRRKMINGKRIFQFDSNSLEYKIGKIIGYFYIYETIEGVAEMSKIEII